MKIHANQLQIEYEDTGDQPASKRPVVLLIMGLGMQLTAWPPEWIDALTAAGYRVLRLDNRDVGLSQHFDHLGKPNLLWQSIKYKLGLKTAAPYTLHDMAQDAAGLLDALQIDTAHVVGVSMGGMIAQRLALAAPQRVASLTSIMSSSGARGLPAAQPHVMRALLGRPKSSAPTDVAAHYTRLFKVIGSPGFPADDALVQARVLASVQRSFHPEGTLRQMLAITADSQRVHALPRISAPTLVLHGKADPLVPYPHGLDTAQRIPGARLVGIEGMGHDLPPGVVTQLLGHLLPFLSAHTASATPPSTTLPTSAPANAPAA